jgi:tetratricopeptide (TPR) repeat protein
VIDPAESLPEDRDDDLPSPPSSEAFGEPAEQASVPNPGDAAESSPTDSSPHDEEGLPEWEPLTPELVEDEAIRGDFMLRWAVILLAVLMGWTVVQETAVLTHIKSGKALLADGVLPSGRDTLAATTHEFRWVHLDWLFDAGLAGLFSVLGENGLTLLKALAAAIVFYLLSRISLPGVPTWWGSVCAALALVACFPSLTATPDIITLMGMTALLLLLHRRSVNPGARLAAPVIVLVLVWSQLDDRAWIGVVALLAYALGHQGDLHRMPAERDTRGGSLLPAAILSLLVMLLHPFLWETWLSAVRLYQYEYPAQRTYAVRGGSDYFRYFPVWSREFWTLNYFNAAALLLWLVTLVVLVLNAAAVRMSHLTLFVAVSLIAAAGGTELAVGSIVFAVLATLNAQQWYVTGFRQTYSVETSELLFSRGGRALTVIALFGLGFMMVAGHLTGAGGRRVGVGFSGELRQSIASYVAVLDESFDDRPFSFRPSQGDVLNWIDKQPFLDSRLRLFAAGSPSIIDEHLQARAALRIPRDGSAPQRQVWQAIFDEYDINQVLPRLSGEGPDYITFYDLLNSPDWVLLQLGADTAVFCRADRENPELASHIAEHRKSDLVQSQLRPAEEEVISELRTLWPSSPSIYSRYFYQRSPIASRPLQRARHYLALGEGLRSVDQAVAALYAAIREAHRGLADNPSDHLGYLVLGQSYATLWSFERGVMEAGQRTYPGALRYAQTVAAYHQAIICDPNDSTPHLHLFGLYSQQQRHDLALRHLQEFERLTGRLTTLPRSDPRFAEEQLRVEEYRTQIAMQVSETRTQRDEDLAAGMEPATLVGRLMQNGYPLAALEVIESDLTRLSGNPQLAYVYARLLLESGRTRQAYDQFQGLKTLAEVRQLPDWAMYEAISHVVAEDLYAALESLRLDHQTMSRSAAMALLFEHPLQAATWIDVTQPIDPLVPIARKLQLSAMYFEQMLPRMQMDTLMQALLHLELGRNAEAADLLEQMLKRDPLSGLRPVAETYLRLLQENPDIPQVPDLETPASSLPDLSDIDASQQAPAEPQAPPAQDADRNSPDPSNDEIRPPTSNGEVPSPGAGAPAEPDPSQKKPSDDGSDSTPIDGASPDGTPGEGPQARDGSPESNAESPAPEDRAVGK